MLCTLLLSAIFAGVMNGAYPLALRYLRLPPNTIWLMFSVFTFLIAPWVSLFLLNPHFLSILPLISVRDMIILSLGGFSFGIGMLLFTFGLRFVGIGITFALNIAVGTLIGSLLPVLLLQPAKLMTIVGAVQILGLCFFVWGIVNAIVASKYRDSALGQASQYKGKNFIGIFVSVLQVYLLRLKALFTLIYCRISYHSLY